MTKALVETTAQNRDRIKALAVANDISVKQATTAILNLILPDFEAGRARLVPTRAESSPSPDASADLRQRKTPVKAKDLIPGRGKSKSKAA